MHAAAPRPRSALRAFLSSEASGVVLMGAAALALVVANSPASGTYFEALHSYVPWVAFLIVPVFGFANAGVSFSGMSLESLLNPVPLGVALGLFVGKQVGVFAFSWVAIRMAWADLPANATWAQFYGVALLCGIGFTMSLFIGLLAFAASPELQDATKLGSALSAAIGAALLSVTKPEVRPTKSR
jgi:Na+:H+ antiporter, NhaA family